LKTILKTLLPLLLVILLAGYLFFEGRQESETLTQEVRVSSPGKFVDLEFGSVHYMLEGADSLELIVFIHGGGVTGLEIWLKNIDYFLENGYRVLAFDLYGRGYSDRPQAEHTPSLFHQQLTQLLERLEIREPIYLVALSMGAIISLDYHHAYPDLVKKMILIDPSASGNYKASRMLSTPVLSDFLMTAYWYPKAVENQRKEFVDKDLFETYSGRLSYFMNFEGYKQSNYSTWMNMLNQNRLDLVAEIDPEDLMVIYGASDPYFNKGQYELYTSRFPLVTMYRIEAAGHMPQYEKPDEVNQLMHDFLKN